MKGLPHCKTSRAIERFVGNDLGLADLLTGHEPDSARGLQSNAARNLGRLFRDF